MVIYIAASWKHAHAVRMLTDLLRADGHVVMSFPETEGQPQSGVVGNLEEWIWSEDGERCFVFDTDCAASANLVIYIGPSGTDAWAEVGIAWGKGIPIWGLWAKGEQAGLMRRLVTEWFADHRALVKQLRDYLAGERRDV
ncbi:MAG: hypothetical protein ABIL09_07335 [Gemmatimonadota bacterium]